jgi:DNA-binding transcriptional LysR family regulator
MNLDWDDVRYFLLSARERGFGAASRRLGTQQSTVSRRVAALEARLGGALFDRTAAGLALTALGRRVLPEAELVEQALTRVGDAASSTERDVEGTVRVALTDTLASVLVIPKVLPMLLARHPKLRVDLVIGNTAADLARREADVAVRFFLTPSGDFVTRRVARLALAVSAAPSLAKSLRGKPPSSWPFVSVWLPGGEVLEETWRAQFAPEPARLSTNSFHAQVDAVRAGLGVALLPVALAKELSLVTLALPKDLEPPPPLDTWLVTPRALRRVPRVAAVFGALEEALSRLP